MLSWFYCCLLVREKHTHYRCTLTLYGNEVPPTPKWYSPWGNPCFYWGQLYRVAFQCDLNHRLVCKFEYLFHPVQLRSVCLNDNIGVCHWGISYQDFIGGFWSLKGSFLLKNVSITWSMRESDFISVVELIKGQINRMRRNPVCLQVWIQYTDAFVTMLRSAGVNLLEENI